MAKRRRRVLDKKKLKFVLWFLVRFNLLAIPLYLAIYTNFSFVPLQVFLARITGDILKLQGYNVIQDGQIILTNVADNFYNIEVSWDSTGWKSLYALLSLVIAVPSPNLANKFRFLAVGLPIVFILNLVRIVTTIWIALNFGFQYFDIVHTLLWREGLIIAVIALWYVWLRKEKPNIR